MNDLENQGHTYLLYDLDPGVDLNISDVKDLKEIKIYHLTSTLDLGNLSQTYFQMKILIFGCIHATDLILVLILT